MDMAILIELYLQKPAVGQMWSVGCSLPVCVLDYFSHFTDEGTLLIDWLIETGCVMG